MCSCQEQRLRQRNTETEESLAKRLAAARADMESSEYLTSVLHSPPQWTDSLARGERGGAVIHGPPPLTEPPLALRPTPAPGKEPGLFDLVIVNDSLDKAYWALKEALSEVGWGAGARPLCGERPGTGGLWPSPGRAPLPLSPAGNQEGSRDRPLLRRLPTVSSLDRALHPPRQPGCPQEGFLPVSFTPSPCPFVGALCSVPLH